MDQRLNSRSRFLERDNYPGNAKGIPLLGGLSLIEGSRAGRMRD